MKKTISLILCFATILSTIAFCLPAMAIELDFAVETSEDFNTTSNGKDVSGYTAEAILKPGLNLWTGTAQAYDFEDVTTTDQDTKLKRGNGGVVTLNAGTASENNAYQLEGKNDSFTLIAGAVATVEKDRPVNVSLKARASANLIFKTMRNGVGTTSAAVFRTTTLKKSTSNWTDISFTAKGADFAVTNQGEAPYVDDTQDIRNIVFFSGATKSNVTVLVDDVSVVPHYKVTYYDGSTGKVSGTEYFNPTGNTKYTIPAEKFNYDTILYRGYYVKGDATKTIVTEVDLANKDIELVLDISGTFDLVEPVSITGHGGKMSGIDYRYPGIYYTFETGLDEQTLSLERLGVAGATGFDYDSETKTLVLLPQIGSTGPGASVKFPRTVTNVFDTNGDLIILSETPTITLATENTFDGTNLLPYGDTEVAPTLIEADSANKLFVEEDDVQGKYMAFRGTIDDQAWIYSEYSINFDNGEEYVLYGKVKMLGLKGNNSIIAGSVAANMRYNSDEGYEHVAPLGGSGSWTEFTYVFTPNPTSEYDGADRFSFYSNPASNKIAEYGIDDLELYRKTNVIYEPTSIVESEGIEAPAKDGGYIYGKGNILKDELLITVPACPYTAKEAKVEVKGWKSTTDKIIYNADDTIDLTKVKLDKNGNYVLQPYVVPMDGYKFANIIFVGDNLLDCPAVVDDVYVNNDTVNLTDYYDVTSADPKKNFIGWSTTGDINDIVETITVDEEANDVVVYAVTSYNFDSRNPVRTIGASQSETVIENGLVNFNHTPGGGTDIFVPYSVPNLPLSKIKYVDYYFVDTVRVYSDADHTSYQDMSISANLANSSDAALKMEGLYHYTDTSTGHPHMFPTSVNKIVGKDGVEYARIRFDLTSSSVWKIDGYLTQIRVDLANTWFDSKLRYIHFVNFDEYSEDIEISGFDTPKTGASPDTTATVNNIAVIKSVKWLENMSASGKFKELEEYTAEFVLAPADISTKRFKEDVKVTVAGFDAVVTHNDNATITAKVTFPETEAYKAFDFDLSTVPSAISVDNIDGTLLEVNQTVAPASGVDTTISWSIEDGKDVAGITEDGRLLPYKAGTITVRATSNYNENKSYTKDIEITLTEDVTPVTVLLVGGFIGSPIRVTRLAGTQLDLSEYLDITPTDTTKRFVGWSTSTELADATTDSILVQDENFVVNAIMSYDINLAVPTTHNFTFNTKTPLEYADDMVYAYTDESTTNSMLEYANLDVKLENMASIEFYLDAEYKLNGEMKTLEKGQTLEGLYFARKDEDYSADRVLAGKVSGFTSDGYAIVTFDGYKNANWSGNLSKIRFDFIGDGLYDYAVRYVHFVERTPFSEGTELAIELDTPFTGKVVDFEAVEKNGVATVTGIEYTPNSFLTYTYDSKEYTCYEQLTAYTAVISLSIGTNNSHYFTNAVKATVNGNEAQVQFSADKLSATVTYTFAQTEEYEDFEMYITGASEISKDDRSASYSLHVSKELPINTYVWSVDDTTLASITQDGVLVPLANGTVKVIATSQYNDSVYAEFEVEITNQIPKPYTITYVSVAEAQGIPAPEEVEGRYTLPVEGPTREGFKFLGWAESDETLTTIKEVNETSDITLYAVWGKGLYYEFNNGDNHGFTAGTAEEGGYLNLITNTNDLITAKSVTFDGDAHKVVKVRFATEPCDSYFQIYYAGENANLAEANSLNKPFSSTGLDDWKEFEFDFSGKSTWSGNMTYIRFDPLILENVRVYIDYIYIENRYRTVTFDANTEITVTGMPEPMTISTGDSFSVSAVPECEGKVFLGWSKTANGDRIASSFVGVDDITLYAIWGDTAQASSEDETVSEAISSVDTSVADGVVVEVSKPDLEVALTFIDGNSVPQVIYADSNYCGKALFDLEGYGVVTSLAAVVNGGKMEKVISTTYEVAEKLSVSASGNKSDILIDGAGEEDNSGSAIYDTSVETITKPGMIDPSIAPGENGEVGVSIVGQMSSKEEILINFDNENDLKLFTGTRQFTELGIENSTVSYQSLGALDNGDQPALFTTTFALDAETHKYIVMKVKNTGYSDNNIRIYFREAGGAYAEAKAMSVKVSNKEWSMAVYDMSQMEAWKGTIEAMFIGFGATVGAKSEIDWIMFTNNVPASMDDIPGAKQKFPVVNKTNAPFTDVTSNDWFYDEVQTAYKLGLVKGQTEESYNPNGSVTLAEAITLAVRLNCIYNEVEEPKNAEGSKWYENYVNYAKRNGILRSSYSDYNATALRKDVAVIMARALPSECYDAINMFKSIPDVDKKDTAFASVRKLYNAGIVIGSDAYNNFYPDTNIKRSEIAAIVNRLAVVDNRKRVITEEEIEINRKYYYAEDLAVCTLGNCTSSKFTISDDLAVATSKNPDPVVILTKLLGTIDGTNITKIKIGLKTASEADPYIYFTTASGGWNIKRTLKGVKGETNEDGVTEWVFDAKSNKEFATDITGIRLDPFDTKNVEFAISYIVVE